ncbi:MAG: hypothetical protein FJ302_10920 [Planctomycetes bacterium]|nr:hypothetical protein [Planctomycetota bacterium]
MRSALRSIAAVFVGFVAASVVMMVIETINGRVFYPDLAKSAEGVTDRETIRTLLATAPVGAFFVVLIGWILGSVAGGWVAARLAARATIRHGVVLGGLLTLAGIANNLMLPPPLWFWIVSLPVMLPAAYAGSRLVPAR